MLLSFNPLYAGDVFKGFSIGTSTGYTNYQTFTGEGFFQVNLNFGGRPFEPKIGMSYHKFTTQLDFLDNLEMESVGMFVEATINPFRKYFFTGIRVELLNFNWFTDKSRLRLNEVSIYPTDISLGTSFYGVLGFNIPVWERVNFRIYGMPGVQGYRILDGNFFTGYDKYNEGYTKFVFQVCAGVIVKIGSSKRIR